MGAVRLRLVLAVELQPDECYISTADAVIIPGGFSYGDHRAGAIAGEGPPGLMPSTPLVPPGSAPLPVLGLHGFQILTEFHLLPWPPDDYTTASSFAVTRFLLRIHLLAKTTLAREFVVPLMKARKPGNTIES